MFEACFILPGPAKWASSRLRAIWIAKHMNGAVVVERGENIPEAKNYIWIKVVDPEIIAIMREKTTAKLWWDMCDPSWWWEPQGVRKLAAGMDGIVTSNEALAADFTECNQIECHVIPDRIDLEHYAIQRSHKRVSPIRFIWFGASQNRASIFSAIANLERLIANGIPVELTIFDDKPESIWAITERIPMYYINWTLADENKVIAAHDIALLPPYPGPWGNVKSNNKSLTAWACGLPVTDGQNYRLLLDLATLTAERERQAHRGYELVKSKYDVRESARDWEALINAKA